MCSIIEFYNHPEVAQHFNHTRYSVWTEVRAFVESLPSNTILADIGCGNGKNMLIRKDLYPIGVDASFELCKIVQEKQLNCIYGNILEIPLETESIDNTICVAVIHHLDTEEQRSLAIKELIRITKPGGKIYIQVWMNKDEKDEQDRFLKWNLRKHFTKDGVEKLFYRYYHYFNNNELEELVSQNKDVKIVRSFIDFDNYGVIIEKN